MNPLYQHLLENPETLKEFLREGQRRFGQPKSEIDQAAVIERVKAQRKLLLPQQLAVVRSKSRRIAAFCTRQAGKSTVAAHMIGEATLRRAKSLVPYVALTKEQCHDIMWPKLQEFYDSVGVKAHFNSNTMRITLPNESAVRMVGAEKPKEILKLLGITPALVVIDEGGAFGAHIEHLVKKILYPALMQHMAPILLVGTPGEIAEGWFYDVTTGQESGWDIYQWSFLDNHYLPLAERDLDKICREQFGGDRNDPTYRREYLGQWVADGGTRVYGGYDPDKCDWDGKLPKGEWLYGLGVDLGSRDGTTFTVGAFSLDSPDLHILEEHKIQRRKGEHLSIAEVAEVLTQLYSRYTFHNPVCDAGALGAMVVQELNERHGFALLPAEKLHKNDFIEHINSDFRLGRIKLAKDSATAGELCRLVWDTKVTTTGKKREKPGMANDRCDSLLYLYRESRHWAGKTPVENLKPEGMHELDWAERQRIDKYYEQVENTNKEEKWLYEQF